MSLNSSTSSSEFSRLERAPVHRLPVAGAGLLVLIVVIESVLARHTEWFADQAAWQWQVKKQLLDDSRLDGDVVVVGTSVLFHAIDPKQVNERISGGRRVVNLSLNGMRLPHSAQLLSKYLKRHEPGVIVLELRDVVVEKESWLQGPYWRFWSTWDEFNESRSFYHEPSLLLSFATNRLLTSFSFRRSLDNWIFSCARKRALNPEFSVRNSAIAQEMLEHDGYSKPGWSEGMTADDIPKSRPRPWTTSPAGDLWLRRLLHQCREHETRVTILQPPAPPFVIEQRQASGFDAAFENYVDGLRQEFPALGLKIWQPTGYGLSDFFDDHHLSAAGSDKLTREFGEWVDPPDTLRQ